MRKRGKKNKKRGRGSENPMVQMKVGNVRKNNNNVKTGKRRYG